MLNALDAQARGAKIVTRTRCERARRGKRMWTAQLSGGSARQRTVTARALVNATGPWAASFLDTVAQVPHSHTLRLVKGSHIVVPKLYDHHYAYTFQQADRRIVFAIPFERDYTLIGTTDVEFGDVPGTVRIDADEVAYLCTAANRYFTRPIAPADVVWSYSGVRPLLEEEGVAASEVTRDYLLDFDAEGGAPLLNVFGGKITTHRRLAEDALARLAPALGNDRPAWTADEHVHLPGGEFADADDSSEASFDKFRLATARRYPWLPEELALRLARAYGTRVERVVGKAQAVEDLGENFGADLYAAEVEYLVREEWARDSNDILWRRSKLGLRLDADQKQRLEDRKSVV